jgi:RNA polymerase sigma factor (sigma-70 family)
VQDRNNHQKNDSGLEGTPGAHALREAVEFAPGNRNGRLTSWFTEWRRPIRNWLSSRSSVPAADIDDLAQEVFLRLLRYSDDVAVQNPQGYLFRIAANVASEWRERACNRKPHEESWLEDLPVQPGEEPENELARTLIHRRLQAAVKKLPRRQQVVLQLHVNDGMTYKQIAAHLGVTHRIVLRELTRAYSGLRMQLRPEDFGDGEQR